MTIAEPHVTFEHCGKVHIHLTTPPHIEREMKLWRMGLSGIPKSYIQWHLSLAQAAKFVLAKTHTIHREWMDRDGWGDGMKSLHLIVEKDGDLYKLSWCDSAQRFFVHHKSGGSATYDGGPEIGKVLAA